MIKYVREGSSYIIHCESFACSILYSFQSGSRLESECGMDVTMVKTGNVSIMCRHNDGRRAALGRSPDT